MDYVVVPLILDVDFWNWFAPTLGDNNALLMELLLLWSSIQYFKKIHATLKS